MESNRVYKTQPQHKNLLLRRIVSFTLAILEVLFAMRLIFKLLGANPTNGFISFIYNLSGFFLAPFSGIFRSAVNPGIETKSVLEASTIIAMIVYALVAIGIIRLIEILRKPHDGDID